MKRLALTIAVIFTTGMAMAQSRMAKATRVVAPAIMGIANSNRELQMIQAKTTSQALAKVEVHTYCPQQLAIPAPKTYSSALLAKTVSPILTNRAMTFSTLTKEDEAVSYKKEKTTERKGGGRSITMYNLLVTNHSGKDLYVFGSVRITGTVDRVGPERHFAGSVPAHSTKCLLTTINEDFNGVRINWQDDM